MAVLFLSDAFFVLLTTTLTFAPVHWTNGSLIPLAYSDKRSPPSSRSDENIEMNEYLKSRMDLTIDPCQDFYNYACGKYTDTISEIDKIELKVTKQMIKIAIQPPKENDHEALKMTKRMFQSCLKHSKKNFLKIYATKIINEESASNINDLKTMITELGGWTLLDSTWKDTNFTLSNFFSKSMAIGYLPDSLFKIDVQANPLNKLNVIVLSAIEKCTMVNLREYFHQIFVPMFVKKMGAISEEVKDEISDYVQICEHMEKIYENPNQPELMYLSEVKKLYGNIAWNRIFTAVFKPITLSSDQVILVECPKCLKTLNDFLANTRKKSLVNYLMASFVFDTLKHADNDVMADWLKHSSGKSREDYCAKNIFSLFRRVMDYEYTEPKRRYYDSFIPKVSALIEKLKTAMENLISVSTMMDSETRSIAIAKVKAMVFKIGYDDKIKKEKALKYFDNLRLNPKSYLLSLFNIKKFLIEKLVKTVGKPSKIPYLEATIGNAEHFNYYNTIFLSINILTKVFYSMENRPQYLNFGGLANVISHEMNHAFDSTGYQFDAEGEFKKWWSSVSREKHFAKQECINNQYSNFINVATGNKVNGFKTLDENFCDIGGIEVAYKAYHELFNDQEFEKEELKLHKSLFKDFENFTPKQMFWITFAASFCAKRSTKDVLNREKYDDHAIEPIRVNGMAINSEEFARDWNCSINTPMNPKEKCAVWK